MCWGLRVAFRHKHTRVVDGENVEESVLAFHLFSEAGFLLLLLPCQHMMRIM